MAEKKTFSLGNMVLVALLAAIGTIVVGFWQGGWYTTGGANKVADAAVAKALAPVCVKNFKADADAVKNLAELKEAGSWKQPDYMRKGGWAKFDGASVQVQQKVASRCATKLIADK